MDAVRGVDIQSPRDLSGSSPWKRPPCSWGRTKGQPYNLFNRLKIPYVPWGKRGKRFRRIDLIAWQEDRRRPALA